MAYQWIWSPVARDDLHSIVRFISRDSPPRAQAFAWRLIFHAWTAAMNAKKASPTRVEIDRRLRIVAELRNLCPSLGRARKRVPPPPADPATPSDRPASG